MSGTELGYALQILKQKDHVARVVNTQKGELRFQPTRALCDVRLCACCALCGTDGAYGARDSDPNDDERAVQSTKERSPVRGHSVLLLVQLVPLPVLNAAGTAYATASTDVRCGLLLAQRILPVLTEAVALAGYLLRLAEKRYRPTLSLRAVQRVVASLERLGEGVPEEVTCPA
eukprot:2253146-Rhodomonas_salina.1